MKSALSVAIGAAAGIVTDMLAEQRSPKQRALILAGGLVGASAIYPLARRRRPLGGPLPDGLRTRCSTWSTTVAPTRDPELVPRDVRWL
jgi:hypothetical protein